jgi:hypothetical protein
MFAICDEQDCSIFALDVRIMLRRVSSREEVGDRRGEQSTEEDESGNHEDK